MDLNLFSPMTFPASEQIDQTFIDDTVRWSWSDGSFYVGEHVEGQKAGYGEYKFSDGCLFKGIWQNDLMHGVGHLSFADGSFVCGEWQEGLL